MDFLQLLIVYNLSKKYNFGGERVALMTLVLTLDDMDIYRTRAIITRGLYTFYPLFEVHLCTVTFGLMYG